MTDNKQYLKNDKTNKGLKALCRLLVFMAVTLGLIMKSLLIPTVLICISCYIEDVFI
ncbi:MAG: hypothetical protein ACI33K_10040 [Clostridiaceae bacterium]